MNKFASENQIEDKFCQLAKLKKKEYTVGFHVFSSLIETKQTRSAFFVFRRFHVHFVDFLTPDSRVHLSRRPPPSGAQRAPHRPVLAAEALQAPPRVVADGLVLAVEGALHYAPSSTDAW